ncbi:MAG: 4'-phosphopantetheinyl transferase superfamily protein [bacterium]
MKEDSVSDPFRLSLGFGSLPGHPVKGIVRNSWNQPTLAATGLRGWCCQCVDEFRPIAWDRIAAPYVLLEPEWKVWHHLPNATARRRWMRGRVAAKDAVRLLLLDCYGYVAPLESIGILPAEGGQPQVTCTALPQTRNLISVSISHCGNSSVALAVERSKFCHDVGIDVASLTDNHDGLAEGGFVSAETALLDDCPDEERPGWLLRLWCAKEAVGKAFGVGLAGNPLNHIVRQVDLTRGDVEIESHIPGDTTTSSSSITCVMAHVGHDRGMAFAVAKRG